MDVLTPSSGPWGWSTATTSGRGELFSSLFQTGSYGPQGTQVIPRPIILLPGFPNIRSGSCYANEVDCSVPGPAGVSLPQHSTCCPGGSHCQSKNNGICCPLDMDCSYEIGTFQSNECANRTWNLFESSWDWCCDLGSFAYTLDGTWGFCAASTKDIPAGAKPVPTPLKAGFNPSLSPSYTLVNGTSASATSQASTTAASQASVTSAAQQSPTSSSLGQASSTAGALAAFGGTNDAAGAMFGGVMAILLILGAL